MSALTAVQSRLQDWYDPMLVSIQELVEFETPARSTTGWMPVQHTCSRNSPGRGPIARLWKLQVPAITCRLPCPGKIRLWPRPWC